ncbi:Rieske 2Fe-2S domain-containing protein [Nocardiopsis kunsanensis]|nr:Rieske 2Fe-2S domain-containing protein [Nocardiopsis kunsanensis]
MGCRLAWNATETSWDCPCHGSRYDTDGSILNGLAVTPLPTVDLDDA